MKAAVFLGKENIQVQDIPEPEVTENDVSIKVSYCGICGSDVSAYRTGNYVEGIVIGHEFSGVVAKVGADVQGIRVGDRVTGNGALPCGSCRFCLTGKTSLCQDLNLTGVTIPGAIAEYVALPGRVVFRLPEKLSMLHATLIDPLSNVLHAVRSSVARVGDRVLIQGFGPIGALTLEVLKLGGIPPLIVTDINPFRRGLAREMGAGFVVDPTQESLPAIVEKATHGNGVDLIFDTTGAPAALKSNFTLVRPGGQIMVVGIPEEPTEADFFTVVLNELKIEGSYLGYSEYPQAIELLSEGRIDADKIITKVLPIDEVRKAFELAASISDVQKVVIKMSGGS